MFISFLLLRYKRKETEPKKRKYAFAWVRGNFVACRFPPHEKHSATAPMPIGAKESSTKLNSLCQYQFICRTAKQAMLVLGDEVALGAVGGFRIRPLWSNP